MQGSAAEEMLTKAIRTGQWVHLTNVHLGGKWLQRLPTLLQGLAASQHEPGFRLWLSTDSVDTLPRLLVEQSSVMAVEASQV